MSSFTLLPLCFRLTSNGTHLIGTGCTRQPGGDESILILQERSEPRFLGRATLSLTEEAFRTNETPTALWAVTSRMQSGTHLRRVERTRHLHRKESNTAGEKYTEKNGEGGSARDRKSIEEDVVRRHDRRRMRRCEISARLHVYIHKHSSVLIPSEPR